MGKFAAYFYGRKKLGLSERDFRIIESYLKRIEEKESDFRFYYIRDRQRIRKAIVIMSKTKDDIAKKACALKFNIFQDELGKDVHFAIKEKTEPIMPISCRELVQNSILEEPDRRY